MNRVLAFVLLTFSAVALAQAPQIRSGATVYIEPNGYELSLAAALVKKQVPLDVVTEKSKAEYIITSTLSEASDRQGRPYTIASMAVRDARSSQIVFAYSSEGGVKATAEDCAKHLRQFMSKH